MACTNEWHAPASTLCPSVFPAKNAGVKSQSHSKLSSKRTLPESFLATSGCFEHNTYHVTVLDWLKKKKRMKKMNNSDLDCFRLATLKQFLNTIIAAIDWGTLYKLF